MRKITTDVTFTWIEQILNAKNLEVKIHSLNELSSIYEIDFSKDGALRFELRAGHYLIRPRVVIAKDELVIARRDTAFKVYPANILLGFLPNVIPTDFTIRDFEWYSFLDNSRSELEEFKKELLEKAILKMVALKVPEWSIKLVDRLQRYYVSDGEELWSHYQSKDSVMWDIPIPAVFGKELSYRYILKMFDVLCKPNRGLNLFNKKSLSKHFPDFKVVIESLLTDEVFEYTKGDRWRITVLNLLYGGPLLNKIKVWMRLFRK